jgi:opacity protein-like surface antigen
MHENQLTLMRTIIIAFCLLGLGLTTKAQDSSLLKTLGDSMAVHSKPGYVHGTFKSIYLINLQTNETLAAGALNFEIQHRFGTLNSGAYNFFGLDFATIRLGFDYGITDWWTIGVGRSSYLKTFDGYTKFRLLKQKEAGGGMPLSVTLLATISNYTQDQVGADYLNTNYRTSYATQLILAKKFQYFSLEVVPSYIRANLVQAPEDKNDMFAVSGGARVHLTKRMSLDGEYNYLFPNQVNSTKAYNALSLGWEIETGGHVFQLVFSNSQSMIPTQFITQTAGSWGQGNIYFGFNLSRNFNITSHAKSAAKAKVAY